MLDLLSALVDKSLVVVSQAEPEGLRYRMLEPVRQYALELCEEGGGAEEVRRLHAAFFLGLAVEARPNLRAGAQVGWLERLEEENGNLRGGPLVGDLRQTEIGDGGLAELRAVDVLVDAQPPDRRPAVAGDDTPEERMISRRGCGAGFS